MSVAADPGGLVKIMRGAMVAVLAVAVFAPPLPIRAAEAGLAVTYENLSEPVLCAEKDNVAIAFSSPQVRSFEIEAAHPAYLATVSRDSFEPDWTACDMSGDPAFRTTVAAPTRQTLYETPDLWLVGWTLPTFWRPSRTRVRIGDRTFDDIHLVQVWMIRPMGGEEVLVVYPQDGYWRLRPKAPTGRDLTAFGSSVLIGPVVDDGRPVVDIDELAFQPADRTFRMAYRGGGSASVQMLETSADRNRLRVTFDRPVTDRPFAMLRSMYVTEFNNDAAHVAVRTPNANGWLESGVLALGKGEATSFWLGRTSVSRHNTSAPDHVLQKFSTSGQPASGQPASDSSRSR